MRSDCFDSTNFYDPKSASADFALTCLFLPFTPQSKSDDDTSYTVWFTRDDRTCMCKQQSKNVNNELRYLMKQQYMTERRMCWTAAAKKKVKIVFCCGVVSAAHFLPSYVSREGQLIRRQFWSRIDQCWVSAAVVLRHEHNGMMMGRLTVSRRHFVTSQKNTESDSAHRSACCNKKKQGTL